MRHREPDNDKQGIVQLNLQDQLHQKERIDFGPEHESVSIARYREMVEARILQLTQSNPLLQKLQQGQHLNQQEVQHLADTLYQEHPHITEDRLRQAYQTPQASFEQFIRHILGIEHLPQFADTVNQAFAEFIQQHSQLNSRQLSFLDLLKDVVIERQQIQRKDLVQSPFTVIHPQGIIGIFSPQEINEILQLTEELAA